MALIGLLRVVIDPVVVVEPARWDYALTLRSHKPVFRPNRRHHRRDAGRADRPAPRRRRRHPADGAVFFHAEVDRLPPLVALNVVIAAGIETPVSTERAHVAEERRGPDAGRGT